MGESFFHQKHGLLSFFNEKEKPNVSYNPKSGRI